MKPSKMLLLFNFGQVKQKHINIQEQDHIYHLQKVRHTTDHRAGWLLMSHYMEETKDLGSASDPLVHLFNMLRAAFG